MSGRGETTLCAGGGGLLGLLRWLRGVCRRLSLWAHRLARGARLAGYRLCACDTQRCRACVDACPAGALQPWLPADTAWRPQVGPHCLGRYSGCRLCQRACPRQALRFDDAGLPQLEERVCDGCGQCKIACHDGHLQLVAAVAHGRG
ncbi:hypothetical protein O0544_16140 [Edwardsiella anguillarum]|nr:hypothetical protein [Edwardsiella anguillarum]